MSRMRSTGDVWLSPRPDAGSVCYKAPGIRHDGAPIGMLLTDPATTVSPRPPGSPGNACTFEVPVRFRVVEGCTVERLLFEGDDGLEGPMVEAARKLVDEGVQAITSSCGFMIRHQAAVSDAVDVPVLLSSLLFAPLLLACMGSSSKLG